MKIRIDFEPRTLFECFECHYTWSGSLEGDSTGGFDVVQCPACGSLDITQYDQRWTVDDDLEPGGDRDGQ